MNVKQMAIRVAHQVLLEADPAKWSATDSSLFADRLTIGLADYWRLAPEYIKAPKQSVIGTLRSGTQDYALPVGFRQITDRVRIRPSVNDPWFEVQECTNDPGIAVSSDQPAFFRVLATIDSSPLWDANYEGGLQSDYIIRFYGTPSRDFLLDLNISYESPVITVRHLSGNEVVHPSGAVPFLLPIPDVDMITMVVPFCVRACLGLPARMKKSDLDPALIAQDYADAREALASKPARLSRTAVRIGTPVGF